MSAKIIDHQTHKRRQIAGFRMRRSDWVHKLVEQQYPFYTNVVRQCIIETAACGRTELKASSIDRIWKLNERKLYSIAFPHGKPIPRGGRRLARLPPLTEEARERLSFHLCEARKFEKKIDELDDRKLRDLCFESFASVASNCRPHKEKRAIEDDWWDFFNRPEATVDHSLWKSRLLTADQLTALSLNKDPELVSIVSIGSANGPVSSPFREAYHNRLRFIELAIDEGDLRALSSYKTFVAWADERGLHVAKDMVVASYDETQYNLEREFGELEALRKENILLKKQIESLQSKTIDLRKKERGSLHKLVLGMAHAKFGFMRSGKRSTVANICKCLEDQNLMLGDDTIRYHLDEAYEALQSDWVSLEKQ